MISGVPPFYSISDRFPVKAAKVVTRSRRWICPAKKYAHYWNRSIYRWPTLKTFYSIAEASVLFPYWEGALSLAMKFMLPGGGLVCLLSTHPVLLIRRIYIITDPALSFFGCVISRYHFDTIYDPSRPVIHEIKGSFLEPWYVDVLYIFRILGCKQDVKRLIS